MNRKVKDGLLLVPLGHHDTKPKAVVMISKAKGSSPQEEMLQDLIHSKDGKEVRASFSFKTYLLKVPIFAKGKKRDTTHSSSQAAQTSCTVASRQIQCSFQALKIKELAMM